MSIAQEILMQMGGQHLIVMVGAKNIYAHDNTLQFDFMRNKSKANRVRVVLDFGTDTYKVQFIKRGAKPTLDMIAKYTRDEFMKKTKDTILKEYEDVYCDTLRGIFEDYTGLRTSLSRVYGSR